MKRAWVAGLKKMAVHLIHVQETERAVNQSPRLNGTGFMGKGRTWASIVLVDRDDSCASSTRNEPDPSSDSPPEGPEKTGPLAGGETGHRRLGTHA